ncbi:hypothetical protein [Priestia filamentosa]|uniref:hypothetical protein n=1 Tax=Priestia filamentosa TaxID=1402861 RepID=UPI003981C526
MKKEALGLKIHRSSCKLPGIDNKYFYFEGKEGVNIEEGVARFDYRMFFPNHPQSHEFLDKLGPKNTFIFFKVLFSYFDAWYMLLDFTGRYFNTKKNPQLFNQDLFEHIEEIAINYDIDSFNYFSLDGELTLDLYDMKIDRTKEDYFFPPNEFQELFSSMNLENILTNHGIDYYPTQTFEDKDKNVGNCELVVHKMLKSSEVGMIMHTWRKLNSYNRSDLMSNVSNILEFIAKDVKNNKDSFSFDVLPKDFEMLEELIDIVTNSRRKRGLYFGLFNSSDLWGTLSRHGSKNLTNYKAISTNTSLKIEDIRDNMMNGIIPNEEELRYMTNVWHYTTSIIVSLWFRLKDSEKIG